MMNRCNECGVEDYIADYLSGEEKTIMDEESVCFDCAFWLNLYRNCSESIIFDNCHYIDGGFSNDDSEFLGYAGDVFEIEMMDGKTIKTNNLWHQGEIPEHFRDRLKNNAKIISQ